jgi:hypothetical protein
MLEKLGFQQLIEETLTVKRQTRSMPIFGFILGMGAELLCRVLAPESFSGLSILTLPRMPYFRGCPRLLSRFPLERGIVIYNFFRAVCNSAQTAQIETCYFA